jgi:hypothetical protein
MTKLLEKAFKNASKLSDIEQNALAKWLLEELEAERIWEKTFAESEDILDQLADKAIGDYKRGKTTPLGTRQL